MRITNYRINSDYYNNIIPIVSTFKSLSAIFKKMRGSTPQGNRNSDRLHYYEYLQNRSYGKMALVSIPVLGNIIAIYDLLSTDHQRRAQVSRFITYGKLPNLPEWEKVEIVRLAIRENIKCVASIPLEMLRINSLGNVPCLLKLGPYNFRLHLDYLAHLSPEQRIHIITQINEKCSSKEITEIAADTFVQKYLPHFSDEAKNDPTLYKEVFKFAPLQALNFFDEETIKTHTDKTDLDRRFTEMSLDTITDPNKLAVALQLVFENNTNEKIDTYKRVGRRLYHNNTTLVAIQKLVLVDRKYTQLTKLITNTSWMFNIEQNYNDLQNHAALFTALEADVKSRVIKLSELAVSLQTSLFSKNPDLYPKCSPIVKTHRDIIQRLITMQRVGLMRKDVLLHHVRTANYTKDYNLEFIEHSRHADDLVTVKSLIAILELKYASRNNLSIILPYVGETVARYYFTQNKANLKYFNSDIVIKIVQENRDYLQYVDQARYLRIAKLTKQPNNTIDTSFHTVADDDTPTAPSLDEIKPDKFID